jgi:hypothetical protein
MIVPLPADEKVGLGPGPDQSGGGRHHRRERRPGVGRERDLGSWERSSFHDHDLLIRVRRLLGTAHGQFPPVT